MADEENIGWVVAHMQGEAYCGNGGEHTQDCEGNVAMSIPVAMKLLSEAIPDRGEGICYKAQKVCVGEGTGGSGHWRDGGGYESIGEAAPGPPGRGRFGCDNPHPYCNAAMKKEACTDWGEAWK